MPIGAAVGIAGLASAGASIYGSTTAASEQEKAQKNALSQQQSMFNVASNALSPFITAGQGAVSTLSGLTNPGTAASVIQTLPGFQFTQKYGTMATQGALASQGLGGSTGPLAQALSQYNTGLANSYWGSAVNALQGVANTGANAGSALAGQAVQSGSNQAGNIVGAGNAAAAGTLGTTNAIGSGAGSLGNAYLLSSLLGGGGTNLGGGLYQSSTGYLSGSGAGLGYGG